MIIFALTKFTVMRYLFYAILTLTFISKLHYTHAQEDIFVTAEYVGAIDGMAQYHLYANFPHDGFALAAIYGYDAQPLSLVSEGEFHQPHWSISQEQCEEGLASGFTIGCGDVNSVGTDWFANGDYLVNTFFGASVFVVNSVGPDQDGRILIGKFLTTAAGLSGTIPLQIYIGGSSSNQIQESFPVVTTVECDEFLGCMDPNACNWDPEAECPDASCIYEDECGICGGSGGIPDGYCDCEGGLAQEGYDCDGMCLNDEDGDGVCDEFEMAGCMDSEACDYDEVATDSAECDYSCLVSMSLELVGVLDFTTPVGGTSGKAIHLLANADIEDLSVFGIGIANNGGGTDGQEFTFPSLSVADGESLLLVRNQDALEAYFDSCWTEFTYIIQASTSVDQNGDDAIELYEYGEVIETFGDPAVDGTGQDWEYTDSWAYKWNGSWIFGGVNCTDGTQTIYESTCAYPLCSSGIGCTNSEACNYMPSSATDDGSCYFANEGYNCDGLCLEDGDGDGVCDTFEIAGCMDSAACNYNPLATDDDSTCQAFDECGVCGGLGILEGVCDCEGNAPSLGYGCNGECLSDENANGICDFLELEELHSQIEEGIFCGEGTIWVEEWNMCIALPTCFGDLDSDGNRGTEDLLLFLAVYNTQCPLDFGCMDSAAINYNPTADYDDGSCEYGVSEFTCGGPVNYHGYDYSTVLIGGQCWFAENLRANFYQNGDSITLLESSSDWISSDEGARSIYNNDSVYQPAYGQLYNWYAVDDARAICPSGWHVPLHAEWQELINLFGGENLAGDALKADATEFLIWDGTNESGLTAVPGGFRDSDWGAFGYEGGGGYYWTGTPYGIVRATSLAIWTGVPYAHSFNSRRSDGRSVRCIQDTE